LVQTASACSIPTPPIAQQEPPETLNFKFGKDDLELLEQMNLLDQRFEREGIVYGDTASSAYVQRIGESLLPKNLTLENVVWKFRVLRDPLPNAFALANGSIYVNTGLMAIMENESQLAAVLAHEITHVMRRHTYLMNRSNRKKFLTINIISAIAAWNPAGGIAGAAVQIIAAIAPLILISTMFGYSRELERDADLKGVDLMMYAEYPPEEMIKMLKILMNDIEGEQVRYFYNDHPKLEERVSYLSTHLGPKAEKTTPAMELHREQNAYFTRTESVAQHDIQLAINAARFRSALYISQRRSTWRPESADYVFWQAESYRTLGPRAPELTSRELTNSAKKDAAKQREKRTLDEEERDLMATEQGQQNWKTNQAKSEELYQQSLKSDKPPAASHRGLGMLYEKLGRPKEAIDEYQKYLELAPDARDRERIQRRIEALKRP